MYNAYLSFRKCVLFILGFALMCLALIGLQTLTTPQPHLYGDDRDAPPRLIGMGCEGASGPLWADEEDEFPPCAKIEVIPLYEGD
jgi:hypothetical protein